MRTNLTPGSGCSLLYEQEGSRGRIYAQETPPRCITCGTTPPNTDFDVVYEGHVLSGGNVYHRFRRVDGATCATCGSPLDIIYTPCHAPQNTLADALFRGIINGK